jgi:RNA polymerase sigma-70 factor (ECF subfamily)
MTPTEMTNSAQQDQSAVAAVRQGDAERYRELIERHERRVYAVAWSRLGNAALAEEVTQEAFIRGYQRLWLLGDGAKFAGWINTIARRLAINFGLRHRRELNKRELWALEVSDDRPAENPASDTGPLHAPETLRQTLAELPAAHRECLVLFYLEGKSGAEAAAALGISESVLRVRLHRARAAMRERLEEKLADSLTKLGPTKTFAPAVMAGVLASSSAKAAGGSIAVGVVTKIVSLLSKTFLFAWFVPLLSAIANLPALIAVSFIARKERQNFRQTDGFRPELHRRFFRSFIWGFPLLLLIFAILNQSSLTAWGIKTHQFILAGFVSVVTLISARSLTICRNPYQISMFAYCLVIAVGLSAFALGWIPSRMATLPILVGTVILFLFIGQRPTRMDYNLFLRAAHGLINPSAEANRLPLAANHLNRGELLAFARFLGSRFLVNNFNWKTSGLVLRLPPVANRFLANMAMLFLPPISQNCSHILLGWDGSVRAHCGAADARDLGALKTAGLTNPLELTGFVEESVLQSWQEFRCGNIPAAERTLGETPESEVFVVPPSRAKSLRWWRILIGASVLLMMLGMAQRFWPVTWRARLDGLKPVSVTGAQVREFISLVNTNPNPLVEQTIGGRAVTTQKGFAGDPFTPLFTCFALPETNLFTPHALRVTRDTIVDSGDFETWRQKPLPQRLQQVLYSTKCFRALLGGWISWEDLNLQPADCQAYLHTNRPAIYTKENLDRFLTRETSWSWVNSERFPVMRISAFGVIELRFLRAVNSLDLVDREKLIAQIASVQTLSARPAGQPPIHDWKDVKGLFFTPGQPALQDTYYSLAALEILGGLDRIDREACIQGILRQHRGEGYFTSPDSGGFNEYHIDGSGRDTIAAFESLRILGALDRVTDLNQWQFRPQRRGIAKHQLTWNDVEAWVCQRHLEKILRQRKADPQAPVESILEN